MESPGRSRLRLRPSLPVNFDDTRPPVVSAIFALGDKAIPFLTQANASSLALVALA